MTLTPMTLRIETADGLAAEEYRISDGQIQVREFQSNREGFRDGWRTLSPAELTALVEKDTIVSQWLQQRLGWRGLLRACVSDQQWPYGEAAVTEPHHAP